MTTPASLAYEASAVLKRPGKKFQTSPLYFGDVRALMFVMALAKILVIEDNAHDINLLRYALDQQEEDYELKYFAGW
ncbi:MAG: hypothetical protein ABI833_00040 [Acidobacteriota bacterium]